MKKILFFAATLMLAANSFAAEPVCECDSSILSKGLSALKNAASNSSSSSSSTSSSSSSGLSSIISGLAGSSSSSSSSDSSTSSSSSSSLSTLIGSVVSAFTSSTTSSSIVGTWSYTEPAVQFESDNLLAKAGGAVACSSVVEKLDPYYEKLGITEGKFSVTLNEDSTCTYTVGSKTYSGTYTFDDDANTLTIKTSAKISLPKAYISVSGSEMAWTYDSTKLLTIATALGSASGNSTLSGLSSIASMYDGMKLGFTFKKQ